MRPCKSYPGNPLNYRGNKITNPSGEDVPIDQVVFRENTEGMYGGVEFFPLPESVYTALCANPKMKKWKDKAGSGKHRALHSHHERARLHQHLQTSIRIRQENRTQTRHADRKTECAARDRWINDTLLPRCGKELPGYLGRRSEHRRDLHVDVQESAGLLGARSRKHVRRHRQRSVRRSGRRTRLRAECEPRRQVRRIRTDPRFCAEILRSIQGQSNRDALNSEADVRLAQGNRHGHASRERHRARHRRRQSAHVRHGRERFHARRREGVADYAG